MLPNEPFYLVPLDEWLSPRSSNEPCFGMNSRLTLYIRPYVFLAIPNNVAIRSLLFYVFVFEPLALVVCVAESDWACRTTITTSSQVDLTTSLRTHPSWFAMLPNQIDKYLNSACRSICGLGRLQLALR